MIFSSIFFWAGEGGVEGENRRQNDSDKVEPGLVVVSADDRDQMNQGVGGQEAGACDGCRPVARPPGSRGERETGDEERHANVLDEMRVERPGSGFAGELSTIVRYETHRVIFSVFCFLVWLL